MKYLLCVFIALLCSTGLAEELQIKEGRDFRFIISRDPQFGTCKSLAFMSKELACGAVLYTCHDKGKLTWSTSTIQCKGQKPSVYKDPDAFIRMLAELSPKFAEDYVNKVCEFFDCGGK
jgi:hypothetical protein